MTTATRFHWFEHVARRVDNMNKGGSDRAGT
jgi:hypothetical protein